MNSSLASKMRAKIPKELTKLFKQFDSCQRCKKEANPLRHILGGGKFKQPRFLFLFINPTYLNLSSHKDYSGRRRYPFLGVRHFYRFLSEAGFLDRKVIDEIYESGWQTKHEAEIEQGLIENDVYLTNLVKCSQLHPNNPRLAVIKEDFPLLQEEIRLVSPRFIVAFGRLPLKIITGKEIRLGESYKRLKRGTYRSLRSVDILGKRYEVLPCYFPVGRGNPQRATEILRYIKRKYS